MSRKRRDRETPSSKLIRANEVASELRRELLAMTEARDEIRGQYHLACSRMEELREAGDGRPTYLHVFVGEAAREVASQARAIGVSLLRIEPNGVLIEVR
jgi:hypothetical protein